MRRMILRWVVRAAMVAAATLPLATFTVDRFFARDVLLIAPYDSATVQLNRTVYTPGDPVAEIYGNPMSRPVRVMLFSEARLIHPKEDPRQNLMPVAGRGDHPLQLRTVWFVTRYSASAFLGVALIAGIIIRINAEDARPAASNQTPPSHVT